MTLPILKEGGKVMDIYETGRLVRQRRRWMNLSQQELADAAGVNISAVRRLENRKMKDIHITKLEKILDALAIIYKKCEIYEHRIDDDEDEINQIKVSAY